ncbi:MAG: tetratricopeptide repeat protein, partial [bacterium]
LFTNGDNDTFPLWFLQNVYGIRTDVRVVNLSLLNTDWYIKQLRDQEPKVPILLNDKQIEGLQPRGWQEREFRLDIVSQELHNAWVQKIQSVDSTYVPDSTRGLHFTLKPTLVTPYGSGIRVQDMMILHIVEANQFKRPIYFAVTVAPSNLIGLENYMRMDGLAFKVLPVRVKRRFADPVIIRKNLFEKYSYRNLNNPEVHYNDNIIALLGNYRSSFMTLMNQYMAKDKEKALEALDKMNEVMPDEVIPPPDGQYSLYIGRLYHQLGRPEEFKKRLDHYRRTNEMTPEVNLQLLSLYADLLKDKAAAKELALELAQDERMRANAIEFMIGRSVMDGEFSESVEWAKQWVALEPQNTTAQQRLDELQKLAAQKDTTAQKDSTGTH